MFVLILPMFALAGAIYLLFNQTVSSFDEVAEELLHELVPVTELQRVVLNASYSVDEFVLHAEPTSRSRFDSASRQIKVLCQQLRDIGFSEQNEKDLLNSAEQHWHKARKIGLDLLEGRASENELQQLDFFHQQLSAMLSELERVYVIIQNEVELEHASVLQNKSRVYLLVFVLSAVTLIIIILLGTLLVRLISRPLAILEHGADQLAAGQLSHRIVLPSNQVEFHKLANAMNNMSKELESLVMQDGLTRLLNRRAFDDRLEDEHKRSRRYNQPLALIMLDIDHFKQVNDQYGHPTGDEILRQMAVLLQSNVREIDAVARYGGEEMAIILPTTDIIHARALAERIRRSIARNEFSIAGKAFHITVSIGLAVLPDHALSPTQLVDAADQALYNAKHQGRDQVCSYNGPPI